MKILLTIFCLQTMYLCKFGGNPPTGSEDRTQKRQILQFLKDGDFENYVTLNVTKILSTLHFATLIQYIKFS